METPKWTFNHEKGEVEIPLGYRVLLKQENIIDHDGCPNDTSLGKKHNDTKWYLGIFQFLCGSKLVEDNLLNFPNDIVIRKV